MFLVEHTDGVRPCLEPLRAPRVVDECGLDSLGGGDGTKTLATTPAVIPASMLRVGVSVPVSVSLYAFFITSNERKRMASLPMEPMMRLEHPLYNARAPSLRNTSLTTRKGFRGRGCDGSSWSWTRVLANSNG